MQDGSPSERKIVKLCEYAAKNPFRVPKVLGQPAAFIYRLINLTNCRFSSQ